MGVWIETLYFDLFLSSGRSHPTWVCGLKPSIPTSLLPSDGHTLRGCVDWNLPIHTLNLERDVTPYVGVWIETCEGSALVVRKVVTPYVGVWIETFIKQVEISLKWSHPTWVCGLKHERYYRQKNFWGHTLRGCVDWNKSIDQQIEEQLSHTLRGCVDWNLIKASAQTIANRHTLRGCVDWNFFTRIELRIS